MRVSAGVLAMLLAGLTLSACAPGAPAAPEPGRPAEAVILVSFDGWRWDYEQQTPAPALARLAAAGVRAGALVPVFPSKTFPNHYSAVTGLYAGRHGITANNILDPETGRRFSLGSDEVGEAMWWGGEPVWVSVERAGGIAATMFWPGSEAPIGGVRPTHWRPYDGSVPGEARVDQVLAWLDLPGAERPRFLTLYLEDVDSAGHDFGPGSPEVAAAVTRVDGYLGRLLDGLEARGLADRVDVVVMSDHGMAAVDVERVVVLDDLVEIENGDIVDLNPTLGLAPSPDRVDEVLAALTGAHPRLQVYRREETPEHWRYRGHPRVPPIVGVVDEGWSIVPRRVLEAVLAGDAAVPGGNHGYDPRAPSMHGIFVAAGPSFRAGVTVPLLQMVDVHHVLMRALDLPPSLNEGPPAAVDALLAPVPVP